MNRTSRFLFLCLLCYAHTVLAQKEVRLTEKERHSNVKLKTSMGTIVLRLYDSTPLHRDNFIRLVKQGYFNGLLFHRVINHFVIQAGDPMSKTASPGKALGNGGPGYTIPAEIRTSFFHRRGTLGAARESDQVNPQKASSGSQFYIVQGRRFTDLELDSVERVRLHHKIPPDLREVYKTTGGTPQLDQNYTLFGEVVKGLDVVDKIAAVATSKGEDKDRPIKDVRIKKAKLVRRKKHH